MSGGRDGRKLVRVTAKVEKTGDVIGDPWLIISVEEMKVFLYESVSYRFRMRYAAVGNLDLDSVDDIAAFFDELEDMKDQKNWRYDD